MSSGCTSPFSLEALPLGLLPWQMLTAWILIAQHQPLVYSPLEAIELKSNFWNIYHMTEFQETCLHKLFSMWVTAGMQLEGNQMHSLLAAPWVCLGLPVPLRQLGAPTATGEGCSLKEGIVG